MIFFINNPWTLVISILIIVFLVFMTVKIVQEVHLNNLLKEKHRFMRIETDKVQNGFKKRISILTSTALAPIGAIAIVVMIGSNITSTPSGEERVFNDSGDMSLFYDTLSRELPRAKSNEVNIVDEGLLDIDSGYESDEVVVDFDMVEAFYATVTSAEVSGKVVGGDEFENVVYDENYYYAASLSNVDITLNSNDGFSKEGTQFVDSIVFGGSIAPCTNKYLIKGLHLTEDHLTVVALEYPEECIGIELDEAYLHSNLNVLVSVIDLDDFRSSTSYRISGNLTSVKFDDNNIYVVTKRYLDYSKESFDIEDYLPYYRVDSGTSKVEYEDIIYVEGTTPDSFTSVFSIDISKEEVDVETVLIDYNNDIFFTDNHLEITGVVYYLDPLAGMFNLEQPVDESKHITFSFDLEDGLVEYKGNEIK